MTRLSRLRSRAGSLAPALAALLVAGLAGGCGTGGVDRSTGNTQVGKTIFVAKCGLCHTLADAGTTGKIGPNLDDAFMADRQQGFSESTIRQVVRDQIRLASPSAGNTSFPVMPQNLVKGANADAVAAYVASVAGVPVSATSTTSAAPVTPPAAPPPPPPPPPATTSKTTTSAKPSLGNAAHGKALYSSLGCTTCHSLTGAKGIGPSFKGLYGSPVKLTNGKTVTANPAYLTMSIDNPDAEIVQGFKPGVMSAVIKPHAVSATDIADLVAFIKTLK